MNGLTRSLVLGGSGIYPVSAPNSSPSFLNLRRETALRSVSLPNPYNVATFADMTAKNQADVAAAKAGTGRAKWEALVYKDYIVHTSLVYVPGGLAGYIYWAAYTPMPKNASAYDNTFENPCVAASNDLQTWVIPPGGANPVVPPLVTATGYNSDPCLYFDEPNKRFVLVWREADGVSRLKMIVSADGITWTSPVTVWTGATSNDMSSPSIWFDGTQWVVCSHKLDVPYKMQRMVNGGADPFTGWPALQTDMTPPVIPVSWDGVNSWAPWHSALRRLPDGRIAGIVQITAGSGAAGELWLIEATAADTTKFYARKLEQAFNSHYASGCALLPNGKVALLASYLPIYSASFLQRIGPDIALLAEQPANEYIAEAARTAGINSLLSNGATKPSGVLWVDSMNRADNAVNLGTADSGGTYTYSGTQLVITGKRAIPNATSGNGFALTGDLATTDYSVSVCLNLLAKTAATAWGETAILFRVKDASNYYKFGVVGASGRAYRLFKIGGAGNLGFCQGSMDGARDGDILRVDCKGPNIECYVNGIKFAEFTDADAVLMASGTKVGLLAAGNAFQQGTLSNLIVTAL